MNKYSKKSLAELSTCHPDLFKIFNKVLQIIDHTVIYGRRDKILQDDLYSKGRGFKDGKWIIIDKSKIVTYVMWPDSAHNVLNPEDLSKAVDAAPYMNKRFVNGDHKNDKQQIYYFAGLVMGVAEEMYKNGEISHKLQWGGDWDNDRDVNDQTFNDLMHFQLI